MFLQGAADKLKREQEKRKADLQRRQAAECRAAAVAEAHRRERDDVEKQERHETRMREAEERAARFFPAADADREAEAATLRRRAAEAERRAEKVRVALEEMVRAAAAATDALVESAGEPGRTRCS